MALTIVEILRAINPNIGLPQNPDGSYRIGVEDVNSDEILAVIEVLNTAFQAGGITQVQLAAILAAIVALETNIVLDTSTNVIGQVSVDQTTPGITNRVDAQLSGLSKLEDNLFEWTSSTWIATQALTSDGVQWSDEKTQAVGGAETQVFGAIVEPPKGGTLVAVILGLTCQLKSGEATAAKTWQWKARNKDGTWVDLHPVVSENLTTSYVEKYRSGVFYAVANFNEVPFEIGLFCTPHASTADATIISQVKNSCTVVALYEPD